MLYKKKLISPEEGNGAWNLYSEGMFEKQWNHESCWAHDNVNVFLLSSIKCRRKYNN